MHIAKQSARGGIVLFAGNLVAAGLSSLASILIARLLGPEGYGLYSLAIVAPSLLQYFTHFGTRSAVPRYIAYHLASGEPDKARRYAQAAILFSLVAGIVFTIISYAASGWIASILRRPSLEPYIEMASLLILGQSLLLTSIAASTGWNTMGRASLSTIMQALVRAVASPILIIIGFGVEGAVIGHAVSFAIAGFASAGLLYAERIRVGLRSLSKVVTDVKELIRFGFPPFAANLLTGVSVFYLSLLLSIIANNATIGYYQAANSLIIPATLLSTATASALYPAFASLHGMQGNLGAAFRMSVKYVGYLVVPILFFLAGSSKELIVLVYGNSFSPGSDLLILLSLSYVPILLGQSVIPYFFNGIGQPRLTLYSTGAGIALLFGIAPLSVFVFRLGVPGLIYSTLVSYAVLTAVGLLLIRRLRILSVDFKSAFAVLLSAGAGLGICLSLPSFGSAAIDFVAKLLLFGAVYLTLSPLLGALTRGDVERIAQATSDIPVIKSVLSPFVSYERRLASARSRRTPP